MRPRRRRAALAGILGVCVALLAVAPAPADEIVPADPWEVIHVAREFGEAEVGRDAMQDPRITVTIAGEGPVRAFDVTFYGCELGRNCRTLLLALRLAPPADAGAAPPARLLTEWNRTRLFGRAWRDGDGTTVLDHAVAMDAGLPAGTLRATFSAWIGALEEFLEHLDISRG